MLKLGLLWAASFFATLALSSASTAAEDFGLHFDVPAGWTMTSQPPDLASMFQIDAPNATVSCRVGTKATPWTASATQADLDGYLIEGSANGMFAYMANGAPILSMTESPIDQDGRKAFAGDMVVAIGESQARYRLLFMQVPARSYSILCFGRKEEFSKVESQVEIFLRSLRIK